MGFIIIGAVICFFFFWWCLGDAGYGIGGMFIGAFLGLFIYFMTYLPDPEFIDENISSEVILYETDNLYEDGFFIDTVGPVGRVKYLYSGQLYTFNGSYIPSDTGEEYLLIRKYEEEGNFFRSSRDAAKYIFYYVE